MEQSSTQKSPAHFIRIALIMGVIITLIKFYAWKITASNAILTDALESIINLVAGSFALFSIIYAARPKDENHPYGHGKMEFLAAGFEGGLILIAGGGMIVRAMFSEKTSVQLEALDTGIVLTGLAGISNFFLGRFLLLKGKKLNSSALTADGLHLLSDTWSSLALIGGLLTMYFTGNAFLDVLLTIALGLYILIIGIRLLRNSLAGLMDEADFEILDQVIEVLEKEREDRWIDIHNLRVVKYGASLHIDAHLTLPWYDNLQDTHNEVKRLETIINRNFRNRVELFIHTDPCLPSACSICTIDNCQFRKEKFRERLKWESGNLLQNKPHSRV